MPIWGRDADAEYEACHIDGAVRFDFRVIRNTSHPMPLMLPSAKQFEKQVGELGISNDTHVVIYGNNEKFGFYSAGRDWWMFKVFGHDKVSLLDGGLPKWISEGRPTVAGEHPQITPATFKATYRPHLVRELGQMMDNYHSKKEQVIDNRPKGRYDGTAPEPNKSLHSGHVLGTIGVPFTQFINPDTKTLKDKEGIKQVFDQSGVDISRPTVLMCGGAVVAPFVAFAASLIGVELPIYDGSWTEWVQKAPDSTKHLGVKGEDLEK
jgi:thiosulfate/3-mercaptopyruvate sulfurtransferase